MPSQSASTTPTLRIGVPRETLVGERRVALTPLNLASLIKDRAEILVESGAGAAAGYSDQDYTSAGARIVAERAALFAEADVIVQVRTVGANPQSGQPDLQMLRPGQILVGFAEPLSAQAEVEAIARTGASLLAMELVPRITRAQSMDALSSMANIAGYKAVLLAASVSTRVWPMMTTAAGTVPPAKVFVIGAGVAGLQAIATAKRLGAVVSGYDVRSAVREQIESLGAKFLSFDLSENAEAAGGYAKQLGEDALARQREGMAQALRDHSVVITTAAVPGAKAPLLITEEMVKGMAHGSVIVDLAAERGGNCALTRADETVVAHDVTILGPTNLASSAAYHASQLYGRNIVNLLKHLLKDGRIALDLEDQITREMLATQGGRIVHPRLAPAN